MKFYLVLFVSLIGTLAIQLVAFDRSSDFPSMLTVQTHALSAELLGSEVLSEPAPSTSKRYTISNSSARDASLFIRSKSCGCIATALNDKPLVAPYRWLLRAGESCTLELQTSAPPEGQSRVVSIVIAAQGPGDDSILCQELLSMRSTTYRDIEANPGVIRLPARPPAPDWEKRIFLTTTRLREADSIGSAPLVKMPEEVKDTLRAEVKRLDAAQSDSGRLVRERFELALTSLPGTETLASTRAPTTGCIEVSLPGDSGWARVKLDIPLIYD